MKKIKIYILPLSLLLLFAFFSCNDTYEFHEKYIEDGEIIYASKVDSLRTLPGNGRIVTGLEEKSYEFDVYSKDEDGNESIKVTVFGTVYGETYRANLQARELNSVTFNSDENVVSINLKPSSELTRSTEIKYTNLSGEETVVTVMNRS